MKERIVGRTQYCNIVVLRFMSLFRGVSSFGRLLLVLCVYVVARSCLSWASRYSTRITASAFVLTSQQKSGVLERNWDEFYEVCPVLLQMYLPPAC